MGEPTAVCVGPGPTPPKSAKTVPPEFQLYVPDPPLAVNILISCVSMYTVPDGLTANGCCEDQKPNGIKTCAVTENVRKDKIKNDRILKNNFKRPSRYSVGVVTMAKEAFF